MVDLKPDIEPTEVPGCFRGVPLGRENFIRYSPAQSD
jgi:hypothetical protein